MNKDTTHFGSDATSLEYGIISSMIPMVDKTSYPPITDYNSIQQNNSTNNDFNNTLHWLEQQQPYNQPMDTIVLNNVSSANTSPSISTPRPVPPTPSNQPFDFDDRPKFIRRRKGVGNTPKEIYARVQQPYNYAESYHALIEFVKRRMGRDELVRISRAIVLFRPSYMSTVASLTEEDLVYMEKCVQRTLLEFEKLISFSGTPTVVWRRTGEIVLVGKEFLLLTQWSKETLLGKKTFIYEVNNIVLYREIDSYD